MEDKLLNTVGTGDLGKVQSLMAKDADPNVKDEYGYTPLILAASEGRN